MTMLTLLNPATRTLVDAVVAHAEEMPTAPAITFLKHGDASCAATLSWEALHVRMRAVAGYLQTRGSAGSRAIVACPPGTDYPVAFLGCLAAGWIPVPAPAPASPRRDYRLGAIAANAGADLVFATTETMALARKSAPELPWVAVNEIPPACALDWSPLEAGDDAVAFLQYTSGSTSEPRGVVVTHRALQAQIDTLLDATELRAGESVVSWMPLYHDLGLVAHLLLSVHAGAHFVLMSPASFLRRPASWLQAVTNYRAVLTAAPNFAFDLCCRRMSDVERAQLDLSSLRTLGSGGEPVRAETLEAFQRTFGPAGLSRQALNPSYGMAESVLMLSSMPLRARQAGGPSTVRVSAQALEGGRVRAALSDADARTLVTCGRPCRGVDLRVVHPNTRQAVPEGVVGEIWARGATITSGYWGRDAETADTFGARAADGSGPWLRTGDLGFLINGALVVTGRRKEVIIVRGHNHYPTDIERTVQEAADALEAGAGAAFEVAVNGEPRVVVVQEVTRTARRHVDGPALIATIRQAVNDAHGLALYDVVLVSPLTVPKTSSGKVQRLLCREQWVAGTLEVVAQHARHAREGAMASSADLTAFATESADPAGTSAVDAAANEQLRQEVIDAIADITRQARIDGSDELRTALDLDSLGFLELVVGIEERFDIKLDEDCAIAVTTADDLADAVIAARHDGGAELGIGDLRELALSQIPQLRVEVTAQRGRDLQVGDRWIADFASANYLGLDLHPDVIAAVQPAIEKWGTHPSWTRIVASPAIYGELERRLASFVEAPDVLVFPTVTLAHAGLLPLLAGERGAIFMDKEAHASVHDGALLAAARGARVVEYEHGDHAALMELLSTAQEGPKIIATDGVFSMSADYEDLPVLAALAKTFDARVYVDDAHGIGVVGANPTLNDPYGAGNGLVQRCGLDYVEDRIIYVGAMSKAFSSLAAFVTCTDAREKARFATAATAVFSGPCPTASLASAIAGLDVVGREGAGIRRRLHALTTRLAAGARAMGLTVDNHDAFPLVSVVVGRTAATIAACRILWDHGILITPGIFPATPHDRGLLRFTVTAANTDAQIERALEALAAVRDAGVVTRALEAA